jgi:hypothetical protein
MNATYRSTSSSNASLSSSGSMSTRLPVSRGWSVHRPNVGTGTAMLSVTHRWSIHVISSVDPLDMAIVAGLSRSTRASCPAIVSASLG